MGLILSARRAGSTQASSPAPSITGDVMPIQAIRNYNVETRGGTSRT